jgi:hypothetical protein
MRKKTTEENPAVTQVSKSQEHHDELSPVAPETVKPARKQRKVDVASLPVIARLSDTPVTEADIAHYCAVLKRCWIAVWEYRAGIGKKPNKELKDECPGD